MDQRKIIFWNATFHTFQNKHTTFEAMAVRDGKILDTGTLANLKSKYSDFSLTDLKGVHVTPGLIEAHAHFMGTGFKNLILDLVNTKDLEEIKSMAKIRLQKLNGPWLVGRGWDQNDWPVKNFPTKNDLDEVSSTIPIYMERIDGHAGWANSKALELAGITNQTPDPAGGKILRDDQGEPTGILIDNAMGLVEEQIPEATRAEREEAFVESQNELLKYGFTSFHDAHTQQEDLDLWMEMAQKGKLKVRLYTMLSGSDSQNLEKHFRQGPKVGLYDGKITVRAIKLFADGALGSRGAALIEPYADDPQNKGLVLLKASEMEQITEKALRSGFQVCTHAIGDQANREVLDAYEKALKNVPVRDARLRIEHAQIIHPDDQGRFGKLGVIASFQPVHCTSDMPWVPDRLGEKRTLEEAYVWRNLINGGAKIAVGSDAPVEDVNPYLGIYAAITRQDPSGEPSLGWNSSQKLSLEEIWQAFTAGGAYAEFSENTKGGLFPGAWADFVTFKVDPMALSPRDYLKLLPQATFIGGEQVF